MSTNTNKRFTVRVYAVFLNNKSQILLCDEKFGKHDICKFPGGGLEWGEGTLECLTREIKEELDMEVEVNELFHVTDYFQEAFHDANKQVVNIYYKSRLLSIENFPTCDHSQFPDKEGDGNQFIRWVDLDTFNLSQLTFETERQVLRKILTNFAAT